MKKITEEKRKFMEEKKVTVEEPKCHKDSDCKSGEVCMIQKSDGVEKAHTKGMVFSTIIGQKCSPKKYQWALEEDQVLQDT